ncbi:hypothetical protein C5F47_04310 [Nitrosopumilus cobalaminigenes]|uniref:Uncharacterized protein n=1 Tax=Nitrosopumilus cobalaminigenes TaxID=1470066 RepID=A0A7D5M277_9ARCH|nr:hypothetical protein C5F47_04310 [Nitrosopumilus cobalaminigenes]
MDSIISNPMGGNVKKIFKVYISTLVLIYVAASILSIVGVMPIHPSIVLLVAGVIVAGIMVAYQVYMRKILRKNQEL